MKCFNDYIVDTNILRENANNIKRHIGNNCKFCAVVKANAYGIGLETVCRTLYGIADFFAVANLKEALSIRVFDKTTQILILGYINSTDLNIASQNNISISVGSYSQIEEVIERNVPIAPNSHYITPKAEFIAGAIPPTSVRLSRYTLMFMLSRMAANIASMLLSCVVAD